MAASTEGLPIGRIVELGPGIAHLNGPIPADNVVGLGGRFDAPWKAQLADSAISTQNRLPGRIGESPGTFPTVL